MTNRCQEDHFAAIGTASPLGIAFRHRSRRRNSSWARGMRARSSWIGVPRATRHLLLVAVALVSSACFPAYIGLAIAIPALAIARHKSGDSIKLVSESRTEVSFSYGRSYDNEFQAVTDSAESHCQKYARHARVRADGGVTRLDSKRSQAVFDCLLDTSKPPSR